MKRRNNVRCASEFNTIKDPSPLCCGSSSWLLAYFACNLLLTIYNKLVLAGDFPFPYTLTAIHCLFATIGSWACLRSGGFTQARLSRRESIIIGLFSAIFTVNILVSNVSLQIVTIPFHQIVRSTTPLFVIAISLLFLSKSYSTETYLSLILVIVGVALATAGDYYFTPFGFFITLLGTLLAAIKTVLTNQIQRSLSSPLHPLDLLLRMSPLACIQSLAYAVTLGETASLTTHLSQLSSQDQLSLSGKLVVNGVLAFALNYVSFTANKKTSPLTMTVAANLKQCLSIVLGFWLFELREGWMNALGILVALLGGAWYAKVEFGESRSQTNGYLPVKVDEKEMV